MSKDLKIEIGEKESKVQRLQDEVECVAFSLQLSYCSLTSRACLHNNSLIIDQIYDSDYSHLRPAEDDLFSDEEGDGGGTVETGRQQGGPQEKGEHQETNGKVRKVSSGLVGCCWWAD